MKIRLLIAVLLVMGPAFLSCDVGFLPQPCYEGELPPSLPPDVLDYITGLLSCDDGEVCNGAVGIIDQCESILGRFDEILNNWDIHILDRWNPCERLGRIIIRHGNLDILDEIGTCQPPGDVGDPCEDSLDCQEGFSCSEDGFCV
jgi:hypothetical protein